jgi:acyl carrier protein
MLDERLKNTILRTLGLSDFPLTESTLAPQVPGWDSLSHVRVLRAVEMEYNIRFRVGEVMKLANVGALQDLVHRKL